jgi:hypothetical protein
MVLPANAAARTRATARLATVASSAWMPVVTSSKNPPAWLTLSVDSPVGDCASSVSPSPSVRVCPATTCA